MIQTIEYSNNIEELLDLTLLFIETGITTITKDTNGSYLYHTPLDSLDIIERGTFQHLGENTLNTLIAMANSELLADPSHVNQPGVVYFDLLGT